MVIKWTILFALFTTLFECFQFQQINDEAKLRSSPIEVRISTSKTVYRVGEPIKITVEIQNLGTEKILVGRSVGLLRSAPFRLSLFLSDASSKMLHRGSDDSVELPCVDMREMDGESPKWLVALAPGQSYSVIMDLPHEFTKELRTPGNYGIGGLYRSFGFLTGGHCGAPRNNDSQNHEISSAQVWKGQTKTPTTWIRLVQ